MASTPSDEVLLALGGIAWEAILVEDRVYQVAGHLALNPEVDPVGTCITKTVAKLGRLSPHSDVQAALQWFSSAKEALEQRNAVLHGTPVMAFGPSDEGPMMALGPTTLEYVGRRREAIGRTIALSVDHLREIAASLADVNAGWQAVTIGVSQFRTVPWGPKPSEGHL